MEYLRKLRHLMQSHGKENIVYIDESGFSLNVNRTHGWAQRGKKIHSSIPGRRHRRTNLIMAQRNGFWLAPVLFDHSCTTALVNTWLEEMLLPELTKPSVVVMDNASFHNKEAIQRILNQKGHTFFAVAALQPGFQSHRTVFCYPQKAASSYPTPNLSGKTSNV